MTEHQQDKTNDNVPARPQKLKLKLLERKPHIGTDIVSFKFGRRSEDNNEKQKDHDYYYLNYKAGQYAVVDLDTKEDPEGPIRSFTLASSPTEDSILISTRIRDTPFKKKLASLDVGISVRMTAPLGKFVLHEDYSKTAVFLSGGIGVTPFRSMMKYATDRQLPVKIILFDANRNQDNILYKREFDECANLNKNLEIVYTLGTPDNDWKGERGHINQTMVTKYLSTNELNNSVFYICGPPGMLNAMKGLLRDDLGISKERIKIEEFTGY
jgi:ferredoxin-NADP reductase